MVDSIKASATHLISVRKCSAMSTTASGLTIQTNSCLINYQTICLYSRLTSLSLTASNVSDSSTVTDLTVSFCIAAPAVGFKRYSHTDVQSNLSIVSIGWVANNNVIVFENIPRS